MRRTLIAAVFVCAVTPIASGVDVRRIDDVRLLGEVAAIDMEKGVTIRVAEEGGVRTVRVPLDEVLTMRFRDVSKDASTDVDRVVVGSGERWFARVAGSEGTGLALESGPVLTGRNVVPFADLRAMIPRRDPAKKTVYTCRDHTQLRGEQPGKCPICGKELVDLLEVLKETASVVTDPDELEAQLMVLENEQDLLLMANGDRLPGIVEAVDAKEVKLSSKLGRVDVPAESVLGIAFSKTLKPWREPDGLRARVQLVDGSVVLGRIEGPTDGSYTLTSVMGPAWKVKAADIADLSIRGGKLAWLSDLEPADVKLTPFFNRAWEMKRDRSVWGAPLSVAGKTYDRGLGVHAKTELTYDLDGKYIAFVAELGVDDETNKTGSVAFSILGDGKVLLEPLILKGGQPARPVKVEVRGVKRLTLIADFAGDDDMGDHADWLNARLVRE